MTKKELIEAIKDCPDDAVFSMAGGEYSVCVTGVRFWLEAETVDRELHRATEIEMI